jgi:hypothetical protein
MPIHRESHPNDVDIKPGTTKSQIVVLLYENLEFAYTPSEIADELDIPDGTATTTLRRLHDDGYIGRMEGGHYHGLDDREDLRRYPQAVAETKALFSTHPDNEDAPSPDPAREVQPIDERHIETELEELDEESDV